MKEILEPLLGYSLFDKQQRRYMLAKEKGFYELLSVDEASLLDVFSATIEGKTLKLVVGFEDFSESVVLVSKAKITPIFE